MRLNLNEIPDSGLAVDIPVDDPKWIAMLGDLPECDTGAAIEVHLELSRSSGQLEIRGQLRGFISMLCSRCADDVKLAVDTDFFSNYMVRAPSQEELELSPAEMDSSLLEGDSIEIFECAREQVLLALPSAPLCADNCRGLCTVCGNNQNQSPCNCEPEVAPSPFAALAGMVEVRAED